MVKKLNKYSEKKIMIFMLFLCTFLSLFGWILGYFINVNNFLFIFYIISLFFFFFLDKDFLIRYIYLFAMNSLYIVGIYACDIGGIYLKEISTTTYYANALSPAMLATYLLFILCYIFNFRAIRRNNDEKQNGKKTNYKNYLYYFSWILIAIEIIALSELLKSGSNISLQMSRFEYSSMVMSPFANKVKANIILGLPIVYLSKGKYKRQQIFIFVIFYILIMYFSGEKFGPYLLLFSVLMVLFPNFLKLMKKYSILIVLAFVAMIGIVYVQYTNLYNYTLQEFISYLLSRLCQQGQTWWSVYSEFSMQLPHLKEFLYEIESCIFNEKLFVFPYAGQWKMMYLAAHSSAYVVIRIQNAVPYTATTMASTFYYFGYFGLFMIYPLIGILYGWLINNVIPNINSNNIIKAILTIKIFIMTNALSTASGISEFISIKGFAILLLFFISCKYKKISFVRGKRE